MNVAARTGTSAWARRVGIAVAVACVGIFAGVWAYTGAPTRWPKLADDAFYYFQCAENVANGYPLSMDRLHATTGFQPLWMLLLIGFYSLHPEPLTVAPALLALLQIALLGWTVTLLADLVARVANSTAALLAVLLLLMPRYLNVALAGLEGGLVVLAMVLVLRHLTLQPRWLDPQPSRLDLRTGGLLALLLLARLDAIWFLLALAGALVVRGWQNKEMSPRLRLYWLTQKGLLVFAPVLAVLLPYLAWNHAVSGHWMPVSGVLKSSFPRVDFRGDYLMEHKEFYALIVVTLLAALRCQQAPIALRWTLRVAAVGIGVHALFTLLFMHWAVFAWHYALALATGPLALGWLMRDAFHATRARVVAVVCAGSMTIGLMGYSLTKHETSFVPSALAAGDWARTHLPADARLAMKDSGAFTYQSRRQVVNLDGVINGFAYQEALCGGGLEPFLVASGVTYIVQHAVPLGAEALDFLQIYPCHLASGADAALTLHASDVVYRGPPGPAPTEHVVIWRAPWAAPSPQ